MRNTKEMLAILTSIHCINFTRDHRDKDIWNLLEYAFRRCFDSTTNVLTLSCIGKTKEEIMPEVQELLDAKTQYAQFIKNKGE